MASTSSITSLVPSRRSRPSTPENGLSENFYHENLDRDAAEEVRGNLVSKLKTETFYNLKRHFSEEKPGLKPPN